MSTRPIVAAFAAALVLAIAAAPADAGWDSSATKRQTSARCWTASVKVWQKGVLFGGTLWWQRRPSAAARVLTGSRPVAPPSALGQAEG